MNELLTAAAQAMGTPEALVDRSARARAAATGGSVEEILRAWAGGQAVPKSPAPASPATEEAEPVRQTPPPPAAEEIGTAVAVVPDVQAPAPAASDITRPPVPERVDPREALDYPVVVSVPTAGIKERTNSALPRWLSAVFLIIPAFGLLYLAGALSGAGVCEEGGINLAVDRQTGIPVNCDGSDFEGRGTGGGGIGQLLALGEGLYPTCMGCHGANGEGGVGPAFTGIVSTFGSCADNIEWVELGSAGFQAAGRDTYGDIGKPVTVGMPGFGASLSAEQIAAVVAFERTRFGGGEAEAVLVDCGLMEAAPAEDGEGMTETTSGNADARVGTSS